MHALWTKEKGFEKNRLQLNFFNRGIFSTIFCQIFSTEKFNVFYIAVEYL